MKPIYHPGTPITDPSCALLMIAQGRTIYVGKRAMAAAFAQNMSVATIVRLAKKGEVAFAHRVGGAG